MVGKARQRAKIGIREEMYALGAIIVGMIMVQGRFTDGVPFWWEVLLALVGLCLMIKTKLIHDDERRRREQNDRLSKSYNVNEDESRQ